MEKLVNYSPPLDKKLQSRNAPDNTASRWTRMLGFKLPWDEQAEIDFQKAIVPQSFGIPVTDDGSLIVEEGGRYAYQYDIAASVTNENMLIDRYRNMALHPELDTAIEDILNEAVVHSSEDKVVELDLNKLPNKDRNLRKRLHEIFDKTTQLLDFENMGSEYFRRWYIDSKLYMHIMPDLENQQNGILKVRWLDPTRIKKIRKIKKTTNAQATELIEVEKEFYVYTDTGMTNVPGTSNYSTAAAAVNLASGLQIEVDAISYVTSGLYDPYTRRIIGYLYKAIRPLNQLRQEENAMIIYRLSRAPERRVYYIDVANLQGKKANEYMREMMNRFRTNMVYDGVTGEISGEFNNLSMMEDIFIPRQQGGRATEIVTLPPGQNLGQIDDVIFFREQLLRALNVPYGRMNLGKDSVYTLGHSLEITRDETKYSKFIGKLRKKFSETFTNIMRVEAILTGVCTDEEWETEIKPFLRYDYQTDSYFTEMKESEVLEQRVTLAAAMQGFVGPGKPFSPQYIREKVFRQTDEEIEEIDEQNEEAREQIEQEQADQHQKNLELAVAGGVGSGPDINDPIDKPAKGNKPPAKKGGFPLKRGAPPPAKGKGKK